MDSNASDKYAIIINWKGDDILIEVPMNSNVFDLKKAIEKETQLEPEDQRIDGLQIAPEDLDNNIPLIALGLEDVNVLLISSKKPESSFPAKSNPEPFVDIMDGMSADGLPVPQILTDNVPEYGGSDDDFSHDVDMNESMDMDETSPLASIQPSSTDIRRLCEFLDKCQIDGDFWTAQFEQKYGTTHPIVTGGPFTDVLKTARELMRPVVVLLQSKSVDCLDFNSLILTSAPLAQVLTEHFIFWVGFVNDQLEKEASRQISLTLRMHSQMQIRDPNQPLIAYPLTLVIDSSPAVLEIVQGVITSDELIAKLYNVVETFAEIQAKARQQRERSQQQRSLIDQQNAAYEESLRRDAEKQKQREAQEKTAAEERSRKLHLLSTARKAALDKFEKLVPEPASTATPRPTTIAIRLLDGSRATRRFEVNRPLQDVFEYLEGIFAQRLSDEDFIDDTTPFESAEVKPWSVSHYELTSTYPKKTLTTADASQTLQQLGLTGQVLLHMQDSRNGH